MPLSIQYSSKFARRAQQNVYRCCMRPCAALLQRLPAEAQHSEPPWLPLPVQAVYQELKQKFNCCPVFMGQELKDKYYKGEQQEAGDWGQQPSAYARQDASRAELPDAGSMSSTSRQWCMHFGMLGAREHAVCATCQAHQASHVMCHSCAHQRLVPCRLLQAAAVASVPLRAAHVPHQPGQVRPGAVAGVRQGQQGGAVHWHRHGGVVHALLCSHVLLRRAGAMY